MSQSANGNAVFRKVVTSHGYATVEPMPSVEELARFYAEDYYQQQASTTYQSEYTPDEMAHKKLRSDLLAFAVKAALGPTEAKPRFLDVGCGEGFLLSSAAAQGFDVSGIEFSDFAIKKFNPGLADRVAIGNAFGLLSERIDRGEHVEVCTLQNVVEHVREPLDLLTRVRTIIGTRGVAVVTVPNDYSRMQLLAQERGLIKSEYWFAPPQHLQYFNCDNLVPLGEALGFQVVDSYGDFPIELFLFHPGSNYAMEPSKGKPAHEARVTIDLLLAERGLAAYLQFCRALTACGIGRNITLIMKACAPA